MSTSHEETLVSNSVRASEVEGKISIAKQKKDTADAAFKEGNMPSALRSYHEALLYLQGLDKSILPGVAPSPPQSDDDKQKRTEVDELIEKIYSNMSACHIKNSNWKRALESADKALAKNENNHKAQLRKGKAQAELGWYERAEKTLNDLINKNPSDVQAVKAELKRVRDAAAVLEKKHNQKMRGFLSREPKSISVTSEVKSQSEPAATLVPSGIEEVA